MGWLPRPYPRPRETQGHEEGRVCLRNGTRKRLASQALHSFHRFAVRPKSITLITPWKLLGVHIRKHFSAAPPLFQKTLIQWHKFSRAFLMTKWTRLLKIIDTRNTPLRNPACNLCGLWKQSWWEICTNSAPRLRIEAKSTHENTSSLISMASENTTDERTKPKYKPRGTHMERCFPSEARAL